LAEQYPATQLPSVRNLQRWFAQAGLAPVQSRRPPRVQQRGQEPHDVWQIDAKERLRLADGTGACVLNVTDEASRAALGASVFPPLPLGASAALASSAVLARPLCGVGTPQVHPCRQRGALGDLV
jgi:hypothetical protein